MAFAYPKRLEMLMVALDIGAVIFKAGILSAQRA
jgi:hypothetical protein